MSVRSKTVRSRTRPSLAVRARTFWAIAIFALCALAAVAFFVVNAPQLRVRAIDAVVPAASPVTRAGAVAAAHIDLEANIWLLNTGAIRKRLEAIPYVATASVHRSQFPRPAVTLEITLRTPSGCVRTPGGPVTIDATARVVQAGCVNGDLPMVDIGTGGAAVPGTTLSAPDIDRLLADAKTVGEHIPVRLVRRDRFGGLEAIDSRGVLLQFGSDRDLAAKIALVEPIRAGAGHGRPLRTIDLRQPSTPIVEFP